MQARSKWRWLAVLAVLALVVAACGDSEGDGGTDTTADGGDGGGEERQVIRFAFAPDPVWDYMNDNGMIAAHEDIAYFNRGF